MDPEVLRQPHPQLLGLFQHAGLVLCDRHDGDLDRGDGGRQDQPLVVAVGHDDRADDPGGHPPAGLERVLQLVVPPREGDVEGAGEPVPEIVAGAALQRLAVVHHRLDGVGRLRARELLAVGLAALDHRDLQVVLAEFRVAVELLLGLGDRLLGGLVDGVALLPPELPAAQEGAGGLFPTDHAAPLVVQQRQVAVGLQHMGEVVAEQRLTGGPHAEPLLQLLGAADRHPGALGGEALDMVLLLLQQALGDKQRHRHVLMAGRLEHPVQNVLDVLPDRIAVGAQDHAALDRGVVHQLRLLADIGVPLGKVLVDGGDGLHQFLVLFTHLPLTLPFHS